MRTLLLLALWLCAPAVFAQECLPNPGPALFFEDFGRGSNFGPPLATGTTSYAYGSIETGGYVLTNTTNLMLNFWHDGGDHTEGDDDGYMLLLNASPGPGRFYERTFTELCPNTEYIISVYIANIVVPTACIGIAERPDVGFTVIDPEDETVQFSNTTGEIFYSSFLTWMEYTLRFRTDPEQTSVLFQLTNNAATGCGNDLAIDDISLRLCNVQTEQSFDVCDLPDGSITVGNNTYTEAGEYLDALPVPNSCNDTLVTTVITGDARILPTLSFNLCAGETLELAGDIFTTSTSFVDTLFAPDPDCPRFQPYEINFSSSEPLLQNVTLCQGESIQVGNSVYTESGIYEDNLISAAGCDSIVITTVTTGAIAVTVSPEEVEIDQGGSVQMSSQIDLSTDFRLVWQPPAAFSCSGCPAPLLQPQTSGSYQLVATDLNSGCVDSATVSVTVLSCEKVFVPNVFTPNGDGINDRLEIFAEDCFNSIIAWRIFDRWGGQVYDLTDQAISASFAGWDGMARGQLVTQGVYSYVLLLARDNGTVKEVRGEAILLW